MAHFAIMPNYGGNSDSPVSINGLCPVNSVGGLVYGERVSIISAKTNSIMRGHYAGREDVLSRLLDGVCRMLDYCVYEAMVDFILPSTIGASYYAVLEVVP